MRHHTWLTHLVFIKVTFQGQHRVASSQIHESSRVFRPCPFPVHLLIPVKPDFIYKYFQYVALKYWFPFLNNRIISDHRAASHPKPLTRGRDTLFELEHESCLYPAAEYSVLSFPVEVSNMKFVNVWIEERASVGRFALPLLLGGVQPCSPAEGVVCLPCQRQSVGIMLIAFLPQLACFSPCFSCKLLIEWFEVDQILFLKRMLGRQCVRLFRWQ